MYGKPTGQPAEPSSDPGAWTCYRCGFRGFWYGGPHECASIEKAPIVERKPVGYDPTPRCIGFELGCGCATCLALDRKHTRMIEEGRRNA